MSNEELDILVKKYLDNTCSPQERAALESWYNKETELSEVHEDSVDYQKLESAIWKSLEKDTQLPRRINWPVISGAAAVLLLCSVLYFHNPQQATQPVKQENQTVNRILPGGNKAELLLADGSIVPLSDANTGLLAKQGEVTISKPEEGRISYQASAAQTEENISFNTLRTPKGGQYQIDLPDGTRVWLNSASSLKFPTAFSDVERRVEVSGEVYFEVAVNKKKPFKVASAGQTVVVLGTHFNVNAYPEERLIRTSLLEGSVKVISERKSVTIKPGQQTVFDTQTQETTVQDMDADAVLAWQKGYFQFNNEDIRSIMRKLSRWYDIEVEYSDKFIDQRFNGSVSRFEEAAKVLRMLEYTGTVHFKTKGRRVTVMP
ncbi:FecR family protein [Pedobacter sp. GR22-6]|uniref:FecR family protein n=1 Tax=Pedobacter sp. GR22-6 TaxID=3127957 RepID=UPI00307D940F